MSSPALTTSDKVKMYASGEAALEAAVMLGRECADVVWVVDSQLPDIVCIYASCYLSSIHFLIVLCMQRGWELVRRLQHFGPTTAIGLIGKLSEPAKRSFMDNGAAHVLVKPTTGDLIIRAAESHGLHWAS
jgi:hypothetical protein